MYYLVGYVVSYIFLYSKIFDFKLLKGILMVCKKEFQNLIYRNLN